MNSDLTIEAMIRLAVVIQVVCLGFLILWGLVHLQATSQEEMNFGGKPVLIHESSDIWLHSDESPFEFQYIPIPRHRTVIHPIPLEEQK